MFGLIRKVISIFFILALYFIIITFFAPVKASYTEISFDKVFMESPADKINKIFSYQLQFLRDLQKNNNDLDKFLSNMLDASINLNALFLEIKKLNADFSKEELFYLNQFLKEIQFLYEQISNNYNSEKAICIKVLLQESKNKLENLSTIDDQMQFRLLS